MPESAREVLDALLWLHPGAGALTARVLADGARLPIGLVARALDLLLAAGLVGRNGGAWAPSKRLIRELEKDTRSSTATQAPAGPHARHAAAFDDEPNTQD